MRSSCSNPRSPLVDVEASHRLRVRSWPALARTHVSVTGALGIEAVDAIDDALRSVGTGDGSLTLDLSLISSITPGARSELTARGHARR